MRKFWLLFVLAVVGVTVGGFVSAEQGKMPARGDVVSDVESGKCVEATSVMRRNHMDFLLRQRDETMRRGIRTGNHSLKGCIDCHEDLKRENQGKSPKHQGRLVPSDMPISVNDPENGFCQACHRYVAVNIDCFQCHVANSGTGK